MKAEELEDLRDQGLLGVNLLKRVDRGMYQLHQLLKEFFASKREQRADVEELKRKFYEVVIAEAERVTEKPERSLLKESTIMITHLQAAIGQLARPEQVLNSLTCLFWIAELYYQQGRYAEAEPLYVRSLSIREQQLGRDHPLVATSLNNLAALYNSRGRYTEAEPLYVRSLLIREQQLGRDHPLVAISLNNLANIYRSQGRYTEAEPLLVRSLSIWEQQLGCDHPDVAISLSNLAYLYHWQGRYTEAERLFLRSVSTLQKQLPAAHPSSARILSNLALLYNLQGRYGEAESLYLQALPILSAKLEESHTWRQEAADQFRSLLQKAIQEHRTDELSDNPMTRSLLQEL